MSLIVHTKPTEAVLIESPKENTKKYPKNFREKPSLWRVLMVAGIFANYLITSFSYVFLWDDIDEALYYVIVILDGLYIFDYTIAVMNFWCKIRKIDLNLQPTRSKFILIIDFLLAFPYSYVYEAFAETFNYYVFLGLRGVVVLRLIHLFIFFKDQWNTAGLNQMKYFGFQYLACLLIRIHTKTCVWYVTTFSNNSTTLIKLIEFREKYQTVFEKYIICFYYTLTSVTNRNFGEFAPETLSGRIISVTFICSGFMLTTGIFISVMSFLLDVTHKRRTNLKMELQNILSLLKMIPVGVANQNLIKNFYEILWTKKIGVYQSPVFKFLPRPLKYEISVDTTIGLIQTSTLFQDKSDAFLRMLADLVKFEFYQTGELIYYRNVVKNKMIFVVKGTIEILSHEDDDSPIVELNPGSCLGESSLLLTLPAKSSVRTASYTELQVLYRKDFFTLIEFFPQIFNNLTSEILERIENIERNVASESETIEINPLFPEHTTTAIEDVKDKLKDPLRPRAQNPYLSLYKLKKQSEVENVTCLSEKFPWILNPRSSLSQFWQYCMLILILYIGITYPYYIVFRKDYPVWFTFSYNFVDFFLMLDVIIILTTAIEEKDKTLKTFTEICQKRLTQFGFYFDFVSCVKIELFYFIWTRNQRVADVLRLNRMFKIYRIPKLFVKTESKIDFNFNFLNTLKYLFYLIFFSYLFGALFYLFTCFEGVCFEDGWYFTKLVLDFKEEISVTYTSHEILTSVYFALSCLTGLAPGDILPSNTTDMITTSITMICGIFAFSCCVAQSSAVITRRLKITSDFHDTLHSILKFMKDRKMGRDLIRRVKKYFLLQWKYDKGLVLKDQPFLFNLNKNIQMKVQIDEKMDTITSLPLFMGLKSDFLFTLASNARTLVLPPNEFVTYKGEVLKILYVIQDGYCIRFFEKSYVILGPKSVFGIMCMFSNVNSLCTVKTLTHVKILCIPEEIFWKSAAIHPSIVSQFRDTSSNFDILTEFKKIPIHPIFGELEDLEHNISEFRGSFLYVYAYCRQHDENYSDPFRDLGILCWIQILMLPICILPYGSFLKIWIIIRLGVAIVITVLVPYKIIQAPYTAMLDNVLFSCDVISYIDLYIMMFVGYYNGKNQLVVHPLKTSFHYLKGKFILDFVVCFPWEILFALIFESQEKSSSQNLFHNLPNLVNILKMGQIYRLVQFFNHFTYAKRKINSNILQILKYLPITLICIHFWSTILIINSCKYVENVSNNGSFVKSDGFTHHPSKGLVMDCNEDSWIDRSKFRNFTDPYHVYILAVYFCTQIFTFCGFGDIIPHYLSTLIIEIIIIISGIIFLGYVYSKISSHKAHWNNLLFKNQDMLSELRKFMVQENVREKLHLQVIERIEYKWKRRRGVEPEKILTRLHPVLYQDIVYSMFEDTLKNVPIFETVDRVFLRVFGKIIKERCHLRQEIIYRVDDVISELCIVERGVVRILTKARNMEAFMETGGIFGNLTQKARHKISVTVMALSNVDLIVMDSQAFYAALERYPSIKNTIERSFGKRTDFIIPSYQTVEDVTFDAKNYPETTASVNTFTSLIEFKANVLGFVFICLPWKLFRIAVPQYSVVFSFFDIYCLVLTYLSTVFITYEFAFQDHADYFLGFAIYADITFIIKILLEMHKTYENRYGEIVTSNTKILEKYFENRKLKRIGDFIINFPFYYFIFLIGILKNFDTYLVFSCIRMITIFRLLYFLDYYREKSDRLMTNKLLLKTCATIVWGTLVIHIFACGWYLCACPLAFCFEDSWVHALYNTTNMNYSEEMMDVYITSLYFIATVLTKTGTGDIVACNIQEQIYISVVMICAIFLTGIFIGDIWNLLNSTTVARVKYDYNINELKQYVKNNRISNFQMKKLWKYVKQLWWMSKGNQIPRAISLLHFATAQELMYEIYGHHLKNSYVFSEVEEAFARQVCQYFKRQIFFQGNYIVQHGDFDNTMYFIHYGEVDILSIHMNLTETIHEVLHTGDMFGVIQGLYYHVPHHFSFRARTTVHVMALRLNDWEHLLDFFPESKESIFTKTNRVNV